MSKKKRRDLASNLTNDLQGILTMANKQTEDTPTDAVQVQKNDSSQPLVRELGMDDLQLMLDLLDGKNYFGLDMSIEQIKGILVHILTPDANEWNFFGAFVDGNLTAMVGQRLNEAAPTWAASWASKVPELNFVESGFLGCMEAAFDVAELGGRNVAFTAIAAAGGGKWFKNLWAQATTLPDHPMNRYGLNLWWEGKLSPSAYQHVQYLLWNARHDTETEYAIHQWVRLTDPQDL